MFISCIAAIENQGEDEARRKEEGSDRHSHIIGEQQPEEVACDCKPEPSKDLTLADQSFLVRVTVHGVKSGNVGIG